MPSDSIRQMTTLQTLSHLVFSVATESSNICTVTTEFNSAIRVYRLSVTSYFVKLLCVFADDQQVPVTSPWLNSTPDATIHKSDVHANSFFPQTIHDWNLLSTDPSNYGTVDCFVKYLSSDLVWYRNFRRPIQMQCEVALLTVKDGEVVNSNVRQ